MPEQLETLSVEDCIDWLGDHIEYHADYLAAIRRAYAALIKLRGGQ